MHTENSVQSWEGGSGSKCLPYKHEMLNWVLKHPCKKPSTVGHACYPSEGKIEQEDPWELPDNWCSWIVSKFQAQWETLKK